MSKAEKFIQDYTKKCSNEIIVEQDEHYKVVDGYHPWLTPDQAKEAVKIAKEEMIEKACEYVDGLIELLNDHGHGLHKERIIGGLKQAMKDE